MTRYVVNLDRRLAELSDHDRANWLAWLHSANLNPYEIANATKLIYDDRANKLVVEILRYEPLGRIRKKYTLTVTGWLPPIPDGYPIRRNNARKENARNNQKPT